MLNGPSSIMEGHIPASQIYFLLSKTYKDFSTQSNLTAAYMEVYRVVYIMVYRVVYIMVYRVVVYLL